MQKQLVDRTTLELVHPPIQPLVILAAVVGHLTAAAPPETLRRAADPALVLELTHLLNVCCRAAVALLSPLEIARNTTVFTTHRHKQSHAIDFEATFLLFHTQKSQNPKDNAEAECELLFCYQDESLFDILSC